MEIGGKEKTMERAKDFGLYFLVAGAFWMFVTLIFVL